MTSIPKPRRKGKWSCRQEWLNPSSNLRRPRHRGIWRLLIEVEGLVADSIALAAFEGVAIVIEDFLERAFVNDGLVALETGALFAFPRLDGDGAGFPRRKRDQARSRRA